MHSHIRALNSSATTGLAIGMALSLLSPLSGNTTETPSPVPQSTPKISLPTGPVGTAPAVRLTIGKSVLLKLPENAQRISVGNPEVADVTLISSRELYLLGKKTGTTNMLVWGPQGSATLRRSRALTACTIRSG